MKPTRPAPAARALCAAFTLSLAACASSPSPRTALTGYSKDAGGYRPPVPARAPLVVQARRIRGIENAPTYAADEGRQGLAIPESQYAQVPDNILLAPAQHSPYGYESAQQRVDYRLVEKARTVQSYALERQKVGLPVTVIAAEPPREAPHPSPDRLYLKVHTGAAAETGWARLFGLRDYASQQEAQSLLHPDEGETLKWLGPQAGWVAWIPER